MQRVTRSTAVAVMPAPLASPGAPGFFTGGDPLLSLPASIPGYEWFNGVQEEIIAAIVDGGLTPSAADLTQLRQAIRRAAKANVTSISASATLTLDQQGLVLVSAASGNVTLTLPAANAAARPIRYDIVRTVSSANSVTVQRAGSDLIEGSATIALLPGERVGLVSDTSANWHAIADRRQASSIAANGWQKLHNGLILQWGKAAFADFGSTTTVAITFPVTFPNACLNVFAVAGLTGGFNVSAMVSESTIATNGFSAIVAEWASVVQTGGQLRWFAIGN